MQAISLNGVSINIDAMILQRVLSDAIAGGQIVWQEGGPALKLFNPESGLVPVSQPVRPVARTASPVMGGRRSTDAPGMSFADAWKCFKLPELNGRSPETIGEYETHLRRWNEFILSDTNHRMVHPVVQGITQADLVAYREWLESSGEFSNRTINKHLGSLYSIADSVIAAGKMEHFPKLKPLPANKAGRKLHLSLPEADRLKRACRVAEWPADREFPAAHYWETLVVGYCVYGFRTQEAVKFERRMTSLQWEDIRDQVETPHPDGKAKNPYGWLVYTPEKQKGKKPEPLVLPICKAFRAHLDAIRPRRATGPVFPFPLASKMLYRQWSSIVEAAGIRPKPGLDGMRPEYQIKHLRKTASRWLNDHGAKIGCPGIGDQVTGHAADRSPDASQSKVSRDHYDFPEDRVLKVLTTLPLPESFQAIQSRR